MQSIIKLLPDSIANQIAAGEVVQRPASVVKELLENAVDAGADRIDLLIKDAGKVLIQVSDNGRGMSSQDVRMAFERHATSKITQAEDLFQIRSMGFRGEALAAIAAVGQVRVRTRLSSEELGTELEIAGSKIQRQEACVCPPGTVFQVKNLFFNIPARRNFLKSNPVETRHITNEFIRIALANPHRFLTFRHNSTLVNELPPKNLMERIADIFGRDFHEKLIYVEETTGYVKISGYIGKTNVYRKNRGEQFFFVNDRYIKSNYLNHAVYSAFENYIPENNHPFYCIFLEIDPKHVDINIHPTKTEVKFDDEKTLYFLLQSIITRALAEAHNTPEFNFSDSSLQQEIYNSPMSQSSEKNLTVSSYSIPPVEKKAVEKSQWENLYKPPDGEAPSQEGDEMSLFPPASHLPKENIEVFNQFQNSYIFAQREDRFFIINQQLAHQRILFEHFLKAIQGKRLASQQLLFPQTLELNTSELEIIKEVQTLLTQLGFEIKEFGKDGIIIYGTPVEIPMGKIREVFSRILADMKEVGITRVKEKLQQHLAKAVAYQSSVTSNQKLSKIEMKKMVEDLFACDVPAHAPNGKPTYKVISVVELEAYFV